MAFVQSVQRRTFEPAVEPNVIPFIDVLLVLLIIFMVTAPRPTVDLRLEMAAQRNGAPLSLAPVFVDVRAAPAGARFFIDAEETALPRMSGDVLARLRQAQFGATDAQLLADARVFVRAEPDVNYADVVAPIDELKRARFDGVSVIVPPDEPG